MIRSAPPATSGAIGGRPHIDDARYRERPLNPVLRHYTGYPKDLGPSRIIPFTTERQLVQLLHEGRPVVVAFAIKCTYTQHLDKVLEEAAATLYPHIKFVRVECPKYPGFCFTRQRNEYPFIKIFYNPEQSASQGKSVDPNITKYSVKVLPFNYDQSHILRRPREVYSTRLMLVAAEIRCS